jgi:hypothetical protein
MPDIKFKDQEGYTKLLKDMGDGTFAEVVSVAGGGGGEGGADRELVVTTYLCKTAFAGASVGDTITATQIIDVTGTPTTVSTVWRNQATAADLGSSPSAANLEIVGSTALTDAQLRASAVLVSGPLTAAQLTAAALATDAVVQAIRDRLPSALANGTRLNVEPLGLPGVARQLAAGAASANTVLTSTVGRISIYARGADIRYTVGSSAQTASATSHFIASGERLDIDVPATPNIAVIRAGSTDGTLEVTELS